MTSSYGYQRPLSNEEQLYLQNQALRAELQRREGEQNALDAVAKTALTVGGLALGAAGARSLLRRGKTPISTRGVTVTDLGSIPTEDVRRASTTSARTVEVATSPRPAPSQPAPKTYSERLAQNEEFTRRALAERPQPVRQGNLSELVKQVNIQDLGPVEQKRLPAAKEFLQQRLTGQKTDLPTARTPGTFREFSREASGVAAAERLAQDPELLSLVKAQEAQELSEARSFQAKAQAEYRRLITEEGEQVRADLLAGQRDALAKTENTIQSAAQSDFGPQSYLRTEGYVAADNLVDQHQARALGRIDQFANAANPAEDQATGRVKMALQRNEDVNLAAIEMAEDAVDTQIAKAAQGDPTVASVTELDSAINQVASSLEDGIPFDQAEAAQAYATDVMQAQRERLAERGFKGQQLERRLVFPQSLESAVETSLSVSPEDALTFGRAQPTQIAPGTSVQPASKTQLRGTTGRPELGVSGIEAGSTPQREVWGQGAVETEKRILQEGENPVTRPVPFKYGINLPEERTPEGYVYTKAAMTRPSKPGASRTPLVQPITDVGRESVELSEQVRRIQREGGDVQAFLSEYKRGRI